MNRAERGRIGEDTCIWYLEKHGYVTLDRNVHSRYGEIDVIAENDTFLCFVEVKTRAADAVVSPVEAVDYKKQQKIVLTAQQYLQAHPMDKQPRFDVFEVILGDDGKPKQVRLLEDAFDASCLDGLYY